MFSKYKKKFRKKNLEKEKRIIESLINSIQYI